MQTKQSYLKPTSIYEEAARRCEELKQARDYLEAMRKKFPEGKIHIIKKNTKCQFYLRRTKSEKMGVYISYRDKNKIKTYLQKKYNEETIKALNIEIVNLEKFLIKSKQSVEILQNIYSNYPEIIKEMVNPIDMNDEDYIKFWVNQPYEGKIIGENVPVLISDKGDRVRSKSELNIANHLFRNNIPYKYECPLMVGGRLLYPDFTVLDVKRRKEIYWEHRGMMDEKDYSREAVSRVRMYAKSGIILGDNLIITEETLYSPLGTDDITNVILRYF